MGGFWERTNARGFESELRRCRRSKVGDAQGPLCCALVRDGLLSPEM